MCKYSQQKRISGLNSHSEFGHSAIITSHYENITNTFKPIRCDFRLTLIKKLKHYLLHETWLLSSSV